METKLFNALRTLFGGRVFPDTAPYDTQTPYCVYTQIGGEAFNYVEGAPSDKKNGLVQVNVFSTSRIETMRLIRSVEDALVRPPVYATVMSAARSDYDSETELRGASQDFSIWS